MDLSPAERDPVKVADWAETQALYSERGWVSFEEVRTRLEVDGTLLDEVAREHEDEAAVLPKEATELLSADAVTELRRRSVLAEAAYPFELQAGQLVLRPGWDHCLPYVYCLLVADREFYSGSDKDLPRLFEHLCREAIASYLGGKAMRFGAPRDTMSPGIHKALSELAEATGSMQVQHLFPVQDTDKDLGLDVVGWIPFPDGYSSHVQVYMQCATGEHWTGKRNEPDLEIWSRILVSDPSPVRALAIPYVVPDGRARQRTVPGLLLLDRLRIATTLAGRALDDQAFGWSRWCRDRIERTRSAMVD